LLSSAIMHTRIAQVSIDNEALRHNLSQVKAFAPDSKVIAVIKANAYGHGVHNAAAVLSGADAFALATPNEAVLLRQSGVTKVLIVLQGFSSLDELKLLASHNIQPVIHHPSQVDLLEQCAEVTLDVWLKVDTGMHRLGVPADRVEACCQRLRACGSVANIRLMSHFANADDPDHSLNQQQLSVLNSIADQTGIHDISMANSAALIALPDSHKQWVRPGIMLYGSSPLNGKSAEELNLKSVMQFESRLIAVQNLKQGDAIGYGSLWQCPEDMRVGVVAAGYADGYPRHAKSGTPVWINGALCPLVGRISMDSLCVDLRGVEISVGERVVLWGRELSVDVVAKHADTISYELLCHTGAGFVSSTR